MQATSPGEAAACLHLASQKYAASLQWNPNNPQALNNWGLVLQVTVGREQQLAVQLVLAGHATAAVWMHSY